MSVEVRIPTPLRGYTGGNGTVTSEGRSVRDVLRNLGSAELLERILDDRGEVRSFVNLYVGETNIRSSDGLDTAVPDGCVVSIIPAVAGGTESARSRRLAELRERIPEVTPEQAWALAQNGAVLVDVREPDEIAAGSPPDALRLVRGFLELEIEQSVPDLDSTLVLMCAGGFRSLLAADDLVRLGYTDVRSMIGGFTGWKNDGLPTEIPRNLASHQRERYGRHLSIPEVGEEGQIKLLSSRVLVVGAGGLGSPAAYYLAAAGVGTIGVVDDDVVDRSNLQRQILHTDDRVGESKVESARRTLVALNPDVNVISHPLRLNSDNVEEVFAAGGYEIVIDGTDNFPTRYLVNDACVKLGLPNVHGSIYRFEGQVSVFWPGNKEQRGPCYRCLFREPPPPDLAPSCAEAGVLGVLPGVIGMIEAVETIKLLLGIGEPLIGKLLHYDALSARFTMLEVERDPSCPYCGDAVREFPGFVDYAAFCQAPVEAR